MLDFRGRVGALQLAGLLIRRVGMMRFGKLLAEDSPDNLIEK